MKNYQAENIFLNKNLKKKKNYYKTAQQIKAPYDEESVIWFPIKCLNIIKSEFPNQFGLLIYKESLYRIYTYDENGKTITIKQIRGTKLIEDYKIFIEKTKDNWKKQQEKEQETDVSFFKYLL